LPKMVRVAGELSDDVVTRLAGPRTLEADIVPELIKVPMMPAVRGLGS
jgi:hypothetical protein